MVVGERERRIAELLAIAQSDVLGAERCKRRVGGDGARRCRSERENRKQNFHRMFQQAEPRVSARAAERGVHAGNTSVPSSLSRSGVASGCPSQSKQSFSS